MNFKQILKLVFKKKWLIFWLAVLGAVLAFDLAVVQPAQYKASARVLVVQKQVAGQDIYSISKSAQYLTRVLKEAIYSDSFFEKVISYSSVLDNNQDGQSQLGLSDFPSSVKDRRKDWQKNVSIQLVRDLGVMEIDVLNGQKEKAEQISRAIVSVLENEHQFYHGGNSNVELKILDEPLVSGKPSKFRLWISTILGALIGLLAGVLWALRKKANGLIENKKLPF